MGLDGVELVLRIEDAFGIEIEDPPNIHTVGQMHLIIVEKTGADSEETWIALVNIVADELGVRRVKITPETSFVRDLNVG